MGDYIYGHETHATEKVVPLTVVENKLAVKDARIKRLEEALGRTLQQLSSLRCNFDKNTVGYHETTQVIRYCGEVLDNENNT